MQPRSKLILIGLAFCCLGGTWIASPGKGSHASGAATATFIGFTENSNAAAVDNISTSGTLNIGTGNLVLCMVTYGNTVNACTGMTAGGQAMTKLTSVSNNTNDFQVELWYLANASSSGTATVTATFSFASPFRTIIAANWSGVATTTPNDGSSTNPSATYTGEPNSAATGRSATNITTANASDLLVNFWVNWDTAQVNSAAASWTLRSSSSAALTGITDRVVSSTGTYPSGNTATVPVADGYVSLFSAWKTP